MPPPENNKPQPSSADTQRMPAVVLHPPADNSDHIPQWAVKGLLASLVLVIAPGSIAIISWVLGGIHSRLDESEKAIQVLRENKAVLESRLERLDESTRRQWELISDNKERIAEHSH